MNLNEQIDFCKEKTKNIKLRTEPQTFIDIWQSLEELKCFRELAEQGLLLQLPCAPGTPVYRISGKRIIQNNFCISDYYEVGKSVFLTREKAETKLKELIGEEDDSLF